jgi:hypothetical protein
VVVAFEEKAEEKISVFVERLARKVKLSYTRLPYDSPLAATALKMQGLTQEQVIIDPGPFTPSHNYGSLLVALTRSTTLPGIRVMQFERQGSDSFGHLGSIKPTTQLICFCAGISSPGQVFDVDKARDAMTQCKQVDATTGKATGSKAPKRSDAKRPNESVDSDSAANRFESSSKTSSVRKRPASSEIGSVPSAPKHVKSSSKTSSVRKRPAISESGSVPAKRVKSSSSLLLFELQHATDSAPSFGNADSSCWFNPVLSLLLIFTGTRLTARVVSGRSLLDFSGRFNDDSNANVAYLVQKVAGFIHALNASDSSAEHITNVRANFAKYLQEDFRRRIYRYAEGLIVSRQWNPLEAWEYLTSLSEKQRPGLFTCRVKVTVHKCTSCGNIKIVHKKLQFQSERILRVIFPMADAEQGVTWGVAPDCVARIKISCDGICRGTYSCGGPCSKSRTVPVLKAAVHLLEPLPSVVTVALANAFKRVSGKLHPLLGPDSGEYPLNHLMLSASMTTLT